MAEYLVTCINKLHRDSPHEHITHIGNITNTLGSRWRLSRETVVSRIESGADKFYTMDFATGKKCYVGVVREHGKLPYLRTYADGQWNNNLLAQQECDSSCPILG